MNDASAVNKILDDAAQMHAVRAQKRNPLRNEKGEFISNDWELEEVIKVAVSQEQKQKQSTPLKDLIDPIPHHIVKGYYLLWYLKSRDRKIKIMNALNYFREI